MMSAWYGSSRLEVVGPAAVTCQAPEASFSTTGPRVVNDAIAQLNLRGQLSAFVEVLVDGVAPGEEGAGDADFVADFKKTDFSSVSGVVRWIMAGWGLEGGD